MEPQHLAVMANIVVPDSTPKVWPTYDHDIGLTEARDLVARWKRNHPDMPAAGAVTKVGLDRVLNQPGCVGIRAYFAMKPDQSVTLVVVGVDEMGNDIDDGELAEKFYMCPPFCPMDSALDS